MDNAVHEIIKKPKPEYVRDASGKVCAAYMRVRTGQAVRTHQPRADALVYFYLGADDRIVGIHMLENKPGVALEGVLTTLHEDDGGPVSIGSKVHHAYFTWDEIKVLVERLDAMSKKLPAETCSH
jgi:hypothetical protein